MADALIPRMPARSMGLKLLLVCFLALLMSIPALFVFGILGERTELAQQVKSEIGALMGGPQTFLGPILAVPYTVPATAVEAAQNGNYVIFPKTGRATAQVRTEVRRRGIFTAPVWTADLVLDSAFDLATAGSQAPRGAVLDWSRAEFLVGASSARGAESNILLTVGGKSVAMTPALTLGRGDVGDIPGSPSRAPRVQLQLREPGGGGIEFFGSPATGIASPGEVFRVVSTLRFTGAQRIAVLAWAENTDVCTLGDWPDPSYDGGFLPRRKNVGCAPRTAAPGAGEKFSAAWSIPYIARSTPAEGTSEVIARLGQTSMGVSFVEMANPYQAVQRSLKYAPLFVGLVFLAYFLFETAQKKRVHPAQYVLIGLAQIIFYLLLLSIAERIGFDWGFLIAAAATVSLISVYAGWVFDSRRQGLIALVGFTALYGLIYVLMRLEDWALLIGALTSFVAIAAVMFFTRRLDWYGVTAPLGPPSLDIKKDA